MGLTAHSTGMGAVDQGLQIARRAPGDRVIALAGNPNVGKSTVFNELTGLNQHTGNWPGKTVATAQGTHTYKETDYILVDLPGTYSLLAHSAEEEVARDFICFGGADGVAVVCDATCLERNLNLVLQTIEITPNVVVCVNLMDEAKKKQIDIDLEQLSRNLGVPVVGAAARSGKGLRELMEALSSVTHEGRPTPPDPIRYTAPIEAAIASLQPLLEGRLAGKLSSRWVALKLLDQDDSLTASLRTHLGFDPLADPAVAAALDGARARLAAEGITPEGLRDRVAAAIVLAAEGACADSVTLRRAESRDRDRKIDAVLTNKWTGIPIMLTLLAAVFWLTITGANYPSQWLSDALFWVQDRLTDLFVYLHAPDWLHGALVLGVYRVLAWVVSVMLPPMAIFFPLFTLLEDFGYLPRVAFNLDHQFKKACACGKQALTMCMGFGCNAAGIVGCRIIDSPRERLIAIITNNFVPCNGRFPTLISIITMFFVGAAGGALSTGLSAVVLLGVIVLGVVMTFWISRLLSHTILKGVPSSFTLELPPYRRPQIGKVLVRSVLDRTLFVLGRAVAVAAPAGLLIWLMANIQVGDASVLLHCAHFLDPFAHLLGMDGVILMAFILGFPANEIVVPIIIMAYMATGSLTDMSNLFALKDLLVQNGWTWLTAVCTMLFCLMHWPCSTTCLTIGKETKSLKWTAISFAVPTLVGMLVCFTVATAARLLGLA
ncbi:MULTISPECIES: ferrous iron transport protein B [Eubacteriales]|uniref:Ferrous iron transport protein B n=1 Tax=Bittarella massiliensis (ex Durand et al. 2017) TaxID=1720313 RepID=A0AAQ1RV61_9FIRM|nr:MULTISPECIES: ferrous iron transport protein B [Eubacteriales]ERJ00320.1 ferrous iron transport protein B [Clostridium sp. ATCC 29733]MZL69618.1 ferrous iron transport protein B [Bittarella massiliensis (ex Durand et al. 2017)]MZL80535.1 ferrous iron transport protein B [Bittarella massiliensis (ex Durand et al. 2017)]SHF80084.1 ferrous iron transport protein B [Bittarella massiliensis (ex Durand et al. 2017)]